MKFLTGACTAALLTLAAVSAQAADIPSSKRAPIAPAPVFTTYNWSGLYVGANAGYGWGDATMNFATAGHYNWAPGDAFSHDTDGWVAGVHAGYNYQVNQFVLGLEGSWTYSDVNKKDVQSPFWDVDRWRNRTRWMAAVTPRIGVAFDRFMVYGKGGLAFAEINSRVHDLTDGVGSSKTRMGWTIGAGAEYALTKNLILGAEYNYYDFGKSRINSLTSNFDGTVGPDGTNHTVSTTTSTATARISYKF